MRTLLTGASGFVGPYVVASLRQLCGDIDVLATAKAAAMHASIGPIESLDITDKAAIAITIRRFMPTCIIHLAGIAAPMTANSNPGEAWQIHVEGTLNLAHSILTHAPECVLVFVGSGLVYGASANSGLPLDETALLDPMDDYAVTKAAADLALGALARRGLKCIRLRPFNHTGPGQDISFVVPGFAMQIARIEAGIQPPLMHIGNLDSKRDFLDVRDVAVAYVLAAKKAAELRSGIILNIASGTAFRIRDLLDRLLALSSAQIQIEQDQARMRPVDLPHIAGDASLARRLLAWVPQYDMDATLRDVLADCRNRTRKS